MCLKTCCGDGWTWMWIWELPALEFPSFDRLICNLSVWDAVPHWCKNKWPWWFLLDGMLCCSFPIVARSWRRLKLKLNQETAWRNEIWDHILIWESRNLHGEHQYWSGDSRECEVTMIVSGLALPPSSEDCKALLNFLRLSCPTFDPFHLLWSVSFISESSPNWDPGWTCGKSCLVLLQRDLCNLEDIRDLREKTGAGSKQWNWSKEILPSSWSVIATSSC